MKVYSELFIFVEGDKDRLFFDEIAERMFEQQYDSVSIIEWAQERRDRINNYIKSIKSENWNADYILVTDMDTPCVTAKKEEIRKRFRDIDKDRIMVVKKEIEGWYLAVLDDNRCKEFGIAPSSTTDDITKEQFESWVPKKFDSIIAFMREILKSFDIETAKQRNESFRYFVEEMIVRYMEC